VALPRTAGLLGGIACGSARHGFPAGTRRFNQQIPPASASCRRSWSAHRRGAGWAGPDDWAGFEACSARAASTSSLLSSSSRSRSPRGVAQLRCHNSSTPGQPPQRRTQRRDLAGDGRRCPDPRGPWAWARCQGSDCGPPGVGQWLASQGLPGQPARGWRAKPAFHCSGIARHERLAPCTPVQATSPTHRGPGRLVGRLRSVLTPPNPVSCRRRLHRDRRGGRLQAKLPAAPRMVGNCFQSQPVADRPQIEPELVHSLHPAMVRPGDG